MHIESFADHPKHLEVIVRDGAREALVVVDKRTATKLSAEAVGASDVAGDASFADDAAAWLCARLRPKRLGHSVVAA